MKTHPDTVAWRAVLVALMSFTAACAEDETAKKTNTPSTQASAAREPIGEERLVTLGGTVTETVYALGAGAQVVAVDASSLYPEAVMKLPRVGYYRKISAEPLLALRPTRVLASEGTGPESALEQLRSAGVEVRLISSESTTEGARNHIKAVAEAIGQPDKATALIAQLDADLTKASDARKAITKAPKVLFIYARGMKTLMVAGTDTPADAMITLAGGENAVTGFEGFKPLTPEAVVQANPDVVLIPEKGLESIGGALWELPGLAQTNAGKRKAHIALDDLKLLGFGPRMGEALGELSKALRGVEVAR